jgi:hypothetical protein
MQMQDTSGTPDLTALVRKMLESHGDGVRDYRLPIELRAESNPFLLSQRNKK